VRRLVRLSTDHQLEMERLADRSPLTLTHGDPHFGNTFATPDGRAGMYDWQLVHRRNGIQDFAHFLLGALPASLRREHERPLLRHYLDTLAGHGGRPPSSFDDAWEQYRVALAYEWDAVAHIVAFPGMQPVADPARTFGRVNNAVVDLRVDEAFERALRSAR